MICEKAKITRAESSTTACIYFHISLEVYTVTLEIYFNFIIWIVFFLLIC